MEVEVTARKTSGDGLGALKLMDLPTEVLIHLFGFLDAGFVRTVLSRVNRRLAQLVADPIIWKLRIAYRFPAKYPPVVPEESQWDWAKACSVRENFHSQWSKHETTKDKVRVNGHYSAVDAILLMNQGLLVTGSRDRSLALWNVQQMDNNDGRSGLIQKWSDVHTGWVWSFSKDASDPSTLISVGWDNKAHVWRLKDAEMVLENTVDCKTALLCSDIHSATGTVTVGTFDKKVKMFDLRVPKPTVINVKYHKMPVLSVCTLPNDPYRVISASEDGTVAVMDKRTKKVFKRLQEPFSIGYPMCMSLMDQGCNCLVIGDKNGNLHLIDANKMEEIKVVHRLHENKITSVDAGMGGIVTSSTDKTLKILQPDMSLKVITTIQDKELGDVVSVSFSEDCLAAGSGSEYIQVWRPKLDNNSNSLMDVSGVDDAAGTSSSDDIISTTSSAAVV